MPDSLDDLKIEIRRAQENWVLITKSRTIDDQTVFDVGYRSKAAQTLRDRLAAYPDRESLEKSYANHVLRDFSSAGVEQIKSTGTKTVRAYYRLEIRSPGMFAIEAGDMWKFKAGLYQLDNTAGRCPIHLLPMKATFLTEARWAERRGAQAVYDEKAIAATLDIIERVGDGTFSDKAQQVYEILEEVLGGGDLGDAEAS